MSSHTPKPWKWRKFGKHLALVGEHSDTPIVMDFVRKGTHGAQPRFRGDFGILCPVDPTVEDHPDAALIAAAPELLEALVVLTESYSRCVEDAHGQGAKDELLNKISDLIAKAKVGVKP